jgi:hypothetical protein
MDATLNGRYSRLYASGERLRANWNNHFNILDDNEDVVFTAGDTETHSHRGLRVYAETGDADYLFRVSAGGVAMQGYTSISSEDGEQPWVQCDASSISVQVPGIFYAGLDSDLQYMAELYTRLNHDTSDGYLRWLIWNDDDLEWRDCVTFGNNVFQLNYLDPEGDLPRPQPLGYSTNGHVSSLSRWSIVNSALAPIVNIAPFGSSTVNINQEYDDPFISNYVRSDQNCTINITIPTLEADVHYMRKMSLGFCNEEIATPVTFTLGTGFNSAGTITVGAVMDAAKKCIVVDFIYKDGKWREIQRHSAITLN